MGKYEYNIIKEEVEEFVYFKWENKIPNILVPPKIYPLQRKWGHVVQNLGVNGSYLSLRVFYYSKAITSKNGYDFVDYDLDEYLSHVRNKKIKKILCE
jgi:hypothetical protein